MTSGERDTLMQLHLVVGRIEGKVDGIVVEQAQLNDYVKSTSERVDTLENGRSRLRGWMAGIGTVAGILGAFLALVVRAFT